MTIPVDQREIDEAEERLVQQFAQDGCKCDLGPDRTPCCTTITIEQYRSVRCQMLELTHDELDLVVMGQVMAGCFSGETSSHCGQERGKSYTIFHHNGKRICQKTFLFLHTMGYGRFKAIKASYKASGVVPRIHGNKGKRSIVQFIMNYAGVCRFVQLKIERRGWRKSVCVCVCIREDYIYQCVHQLISVLVHEVFHASISITYLTDSNAMLLPGRVPGYKDF